MTKGDTLAVRYKDGSFNVTVDNLSTCRSCDAQIAWCETSKGKKMPVDSEPDEEGLYSSHFSTCPNADEHRGGGEAKTKPASASSPSLADRVKKLEEAVFGILAGRGPLAVNVDIPPPDDSLPF